VWSHWVVKVAVARFAPERATLFVDAEAALFAARLESASEAAVARSVGAHRVARARLPRAAAKLGGRWYSSPAYARHRGQGQRWSDREQTALREKLLSGVLLERSHETYQKDSAGLLRRGLLRNGEFFFRASLLTALAVNRFRATLRASLADLLRSTRLPLPQRVLELVAPYERLVKAALPGEFHVVAQNNPTIGADRFDAELFPRLLGLDGRTRLPPCVARAHLALRRRHHLHYHGRVRYAFFVRQFMAWPQAQLLFAQEFAKQQNVAKREWPTYEGNSSASLRRTSTPTAAPNSRPNARRTATSTNSTAAPSSSTRAPTSKTFCV